MKVPGYVCLDRLNGMTATDVTSLPVCKQVRTDLIPRLTALGRGEYARTAG